VPLPALAFSPLAGEVAETLARVPAAAGVGQILGPEGKSLVLATASNLRKWAGSHLGLGKPAAPGRRPRTSLAGLATAVGWVEADAPFRQRLLYERLMAPLVPLASRRDLKPPAFLHLDPAERFPRVSVRATTGRPPGLFGPFRDRRAAERARDALHRLFPLRPCDASFEPDPALPLGLGCLYAQVRSCAAPCLARSSEDEYRALAGRAAAWLGRPSLRDGAEAALPPTVATLDGVRAVIVDAGRRDVGLYPVREGRVVDDAAILGPPSALEASIDRLEWPEPEGPDDWPWLAAWLRGARGRATWVVAGEGPDREALAAAVRHVLPARFAPPGPGDNVRVAQREA
jgi:hypothetical protein